MRLIILIAALLSWILAGFILYGDWHFKGDHIISGLLIGISMICIFAVYIFKKN